MKKTYRATCLIRATDKGINIWLPNDAIETAQQMPDEEAQEVKK